MNLWDKNSEPEGIIQIRLTLFGGQERIPPKATPKIVFCTISKDMVFHILSSRFKSSKQVGFYSDGSSGIVDNSTSSHKLSEEDICTDKIEPIICML